MSLCAEFITMLRRYSDLLLGLLKTGVRIAINGGVPTWPACILLVLRNRHVGESRAFPLPVSFYLAEHKKMLSIDKLFPRSSQRRALLVGHLKNAASLPPHRLRSVDSFSEPFFIVGPGRCGTTLLRRLLQASSDVHIPPENWAMARWIHQFFKYRKVLSWEEMCGVLVNTFLLRNQGWFDLIPENLFGKLRDMPIQYRTLADFIDTLYRFHGDHVGAEFKRWGDKTPLNVDAMPSILRVFPDAAFIFMLRDPADVVYSMSKMDDYFNEFERPAIRWRDAYERYTSMKAKQGSRITLVRYEELVTEPSSVMERVADFLGLEYKHEWLEEKSGLVTLNDLESVTHLKAALEPISESSIGRGRKKLTADQLRVIGHLTSKQAADAGYAGFSANRM